MRGSGQSGVCIKCKKEPTEEGHDGCLGTLPSKNVMNACCGHGDGNLAYIQYFRGKIVTGKEAIFKQRRLISKSKLTIK